MRFASAFIFSLILYVLGIMTGWYLNGYQQLSDTGELSANLIEQKLFPGASSRSEQATGQQIDHSVLMVQKKPILGTTQHSAPSSHIATRLTDDQVTFLTSLHQLRLEDALLLYQQHERNNSPDFFHLRRALLSTVDQMEKSPKGLEVLEYFTQYYYDDQPLLERYATQLEKQNQLQRALEVRISARQFTSDEIRISSQTRQIHRLARELFKQYQRQQKLDQTLPLFQQLATVEPDHSFYRFALAQSWLQTGSPDSAIQELELLESDPVFGQKARDLLAALLPSPEIESTTSGAIPLQPWGQHFIVTTLAGRRQPLDLLLDTGASVTTLPPYLLQRLASTGNARRIGQVRLSTANGIRSTNLYRIKTLQLGGYELRDLDVAELPLDDGSGADGLLGMDILGLFDFRLDQDSRTLTLISRK
ncbi:aspartyl protease family protein [Endozoicomonadaceae bacterium StTr2]